MGDPVRLAALCVLLSVLAPFSSSAFVAVHANASLTNFLSPYLSNSIISNSTFIEIDYAGSTYLLMNLTQNRHILINTTPALSFVMNTSSAYNILKPTLIALYYPDQSTINSLYTTMTSYMNGASSSLNECLTLTGTASYTCTLTTPVDICLLNTCQRVPICGGNLKAPLQSALYKFGIPSPFSNGIQNLSITYALLNGSYNSYFATFSNMNQSNIGYKLTALSSILGNISSESKTLLQSPLFPPPTNITPSQFIICSSYNIFNAPWWCVATGFCNYVNFNSTILTSLQNQVNILLSKPLTNASIKSFATAAVNTTNFYVEPVLEKTNTAIFKAFMNVTLPKYNATVANVTFLLGRYQSNSLTQSLAGLETTFATIQTKGINQNITNASLTMNALLRNLSTLYTQLNSLYVPTFNSAFNTSVMILLKELDYQQVPARLAQLAAQSEQVGATLLRQLSASQLSAAANAINGISLNASAISGPASLPEFVKAVDGPFVDYMLSGSALPISSKIGAGALYAALLSFIIGVALLLLFYFGTYHRLRRHKRIRHTKRVRKAWHLLFILLFILMLLYAYMTYTYANLAAEFMPASGFFARAVSSNAIVVAINTNSANVLNSSVSNCAAALSKSLIAFNKSVQSIRLSNYSCVSSSTSNTVSQDCYNSVLNSDTPVIQINANADSYIVYNGLYGTVLQASGSPTYGSSCVLNSLVRYALR